MRVRFSTYRVTGMLGAAALTMLFVTTPGLRAEDESNPRRSVSNGLHTVKIVDVLNLFSNVGALIYVAEPNDFGIPAGIATHCTGTLIHERLSGRGPLHGPDGRGASPIHQGIRHLQSECSGSVHLAAGVEFRLPSLPPAMPSTCRLYSSRDSILASLMLASCSSAG